MARMQKPTKLEDVDVRGYDAIFVPGGLAPMVDMPEHPQLKQVVKETWERGAVVGAAATVRFRCSTSVEQRNLPSRRQKYLVLHERRGERYAEKDVPFELETALTKQGAIFHKTKPWGAFSIQDGKLVTGQNPASAQGVAEKIIKLLENQTT